MNIKKSFLYRPAKLYIKNDFFSFIWYYRSSNNDKLTRYRHTFNINRITDLKTRKKVANILIKSINGCLENNINPINEVSNITDDAVTQHKETNTVTLLNIAYDHLCKRTNKIRSVQAYATHQKYLLQFIQDKKAKEISTIDKKFINDYQDHLINKSYSNKTINTKVDYFKSLLQFLTDNDYITTNPASSVKSLKEKDSTTHDVFTLEEIQTIKKHLWQDNKSLWIIFNLIYYAYLRPATIVTLKKKNIDLQNRLIQIEAQHHKNGKEQFKQILNPLFILLDEYLRDIPDDYYLFSRDMVPGLNCIKPTRISELWKKLIKDELGINKNIYGAKHTGAIHFLEKNHGNENLKWLQMQMSHSDLQTTSIYTNKIKKVQLDESKTNIFEL